MNANTNNNINADDEASLGGQDFPTKANAKNNNEASLRGQKSYGGASPASKRRRSERDSAEPASVVATVNDTNTNHVGDTSQFREALLYAKQLLRDGILSRGRKSEREEPLHVPGRSSSYRGTGLLCELYN